MGNEIRFYLSVFWRRFHYFTLIAVVVTAAGVAVAVLLPTKYRSDALLLAESAQIPGNLAELTVDTSAEETLQIIENRLLTRDNLLDIASDNNVFRDRGSLYPDEVVDLMREATTFRITSGKDTAALITVGFESSDPRTAAAVVGAYVSRVLETNVELRRGRAEDTLEFFQQEKERLAEDLSSKSTSILRFKNENLDSLPENLEYQLDRLDRLRDRVEIISRDIDSLRKQRERLIVVYEMTGGQGAQQDLRSPKQQELDAAKSELASALTVYSAQNPRVKVLQNQISKLEAEVAAARPEESTQDPDADAPTPLSLQLEDIDDEIERLGVEAERITPLITEYEANIARTPSVSVRLDGLQREYQNIQQQYNDAVSRAATAATGERIELMSKGGRISVVSQPVVPRVPTSPNRPLIAAAGAGAGIALGLAFVVLLEVLNSAIRRPVDITRALGIDPLATLPLMRTPHEARMRRVLVVGIILASAALIVGAIVAAHVYIAPLDFLISDLVGRLGL